MTTELINTISSWISSQILLKENTINEFKSWLKDGNYDDEADEYITKCYKNGNSIRIKELATPAFNKFNA